MEFENSKLRKIFREFHPMHESRLRFLELRHSVSISMSEFTEYNFLYCFFRPIRHHLTWLMCSWKNREMPSFMLISRSFTSFKPLFEKFPA